MGHHRLPPAPTLTYGEHPDQVANLHLPAADGGPWPCVVLLHGGFWRTGWDRTLMTPLAIGLAREGVAVWNVEYRRVGQAGGGWPGTLEDVASATDRLAEVKEVDAGRVATCGHSAGGHLALWLAARHRLAGGQVGSTPRVRPLGAVALAGVCDLEQAWRDGLGRGAAEGLLGSLDAEPGRYAAASPSALAPLGVPQLLVHGEADDIVPIGQSRSFADLEPDASLVALPDADHFDVVDPEHAGWAAAAEWLLRRLGREGPTALR